MPIHVVPAGSSVRVSRFRRRFPRIAGWFVTATAIALAIATGLVSEIAAKDHILVLGGGPTIQNSEFSIEQNVVYFQTILKKLEFDKPSMTILFGSGAGETMDVRLRLPEPKNTVHRDLKRLFGDDQELLNCDYRHHSVTDVRADCRKATVMSQLEKLAKTLQRQDRLLIYMTGHGGKGSPLDNGHFYTWDNGKIDVREFTKVLDTFSPDVTVVLVMVQCYSGSFANIVFRGGNPENGPAPHARVGFFAAPDNMPAAGCTPDTKIADYQDYSTFFWAAMSGQSRTLKTIRAQDFDRDGDISASEAHAYVLVNSTTIDVPMKTSDRFLSYVAAQLSKRKAAGVSGKNADASKAKEPVTKETLATVTDTETLAKLLAQNAGKFKSKDDLDWLADHNALAVLALAPRAEKYVLESLFKEFGLSGPEALHKARALLTTLDQQHKDAERDKRQTQRNSRQQQMVIRNVLLQRWPYLKSAWHPRTQALLQADRPDAEFSKVISALPSYRPWVENLRLAATQEDKAWDLEKRHCKLQRLSKVSDTVINQYLLMNSGETQWIAKYQKLRDLENQSLKAPCSTGAVSGATISSE